MRKLLLSIIYMATVLLMSMQTLAADASIIEGKIDVKAQYTEKDLENSTILGSGQSITLQDGTVIIIKSNDEADDDIKAVVIPITKEEEEAYNYAIDMTKEYGQNPYAFYVLFYRNGVEVTPSKPVTVTVTVPDEYEKSTLYSFTGDGKSPEELSWQVKEGAWTFDIADSRYFAMLLPKTDNNGGANGTDDPTNTNNGTNINNGTSNNNETNTSTNGISTNTAARTTSTSINSTTSRTIVTGNGVSSTSSQTSRAKTGDETPIGFWFIVLVGSIVLMLVTVRMYRRGQKNL